jgi:hypothetical protein
LLVRITQLCFFYRSQENINPTLPSFEKNKFSIVAVFVSFRPTTNKLVIGRKDTTNGKISLYKTGLHQSALRNSKTFLKAGLS